MINAYKKLIESMEKASIARDQKLADSIDSVIRQQNISGQLGALQIQKEILAHVYEKASSYTNLVMIGGYAGMFAIWQLMKAHLTNGQELLVAILISSSLILFAGFEVFKMVFHAIFFRRLHRILSSNFPDHKRAEGWQIAWKDYATKESRIWIFFLIPTVLTGFGAGLFLLSIFLRNLLASI